MTVADSAGRLRVPAAAHQFVFDAGAPPAAVVDSGDVVLIETLDCFSNKLTADTPPLRDDRDVLEHIGGRYNPVSAPIFVRDAEPGDVLAVDILDIALGRRQGFAVTHVAHDWAKAFGGPAFADAVAPEMTIAEIDGTTLRLPIGGLTVTCKARPMIGTIGTAPAGEPASSLIYSPAHGGNLDCPMMRAGATVLLPVNVPGGLLSLGDVHALMGDGEVTGTALETSADVTVRIRLLKRTDTALTTPRLTDSEGIGSIGCSSRTKPAGQHRRGGTRPRCDACARLRSGTGGGDAADQPLRADHREPDGRKRDRAVGERARTLPHSDLEPFAHKRAEAARAKHGLSQ